MPRRRRQGSGGSRLPTPSPLLVLAATLGCAPPVIPVHTVALQDGRLAVPMVDVELGNGRLPFILDSGAEWHFVVDAAAWSFGVATGDIGVVARDSGGSEVDAVLAAPGALRISALPEDRLEPLVIMRSPSLRGFGFWGGVSPQRLARSGERVVVDFRAGRMTIVPEDEARPAPAGEGTAGGSLEHCRLGTGDSENGSRYLVRATIDGRDVRLSLDTGASGTLLFDDTEVGRGLVAGAPPEEPPEAADGEPGGAPATDENPRIVREREVWVGGVVDVLAVRDVQVGLGGLVWTTSVSVASRGELRECPADGILGFDVLRYCTLSFGPDAGDWSCSLDPPRPPESLGPDPAGPVYLVAMDSVTGCGRTEDELRPVLETHQWPVSFPSLLDALAPLFGIAESYANWVQWRCEGNGYPGARVSSALARSGDELTMRFAIDDGPRFRVRSSAIAVLDQDGAVVRRLDPADLPWWRQQPGAWYSRDDWDDDINALWDRSELAVGERGVSFTHRTYDYETAEVDLAVEFQPDR